MPFFGEARVPYSATCRARRLRRSCCPRRRGQPAAGLHAGGGAGTDPHADPLRRARPVRGRRALPARPAFELGLEGERRESCTDRTEHGLMLRGRSQTFKDRLPGPPDQGDSLVTGAAQSGGRSAAGRRILARPLLSISIRYRLGVWDMNVGKDLLHQLKQCVILHSRDARAPRRRRAARNRRKSSRSWRHHRRLRWTVKGPEVARNVGRRP